ncbi:hypothetical protein HO133_000620 [Letharia lupina]|uniref:Uncharacterized protein n=1 Tax=Letharia lupina TaxID=560253 RepID=A0A8H6FCB5_9LECA|nr:uncharacterized protein HO133_000620 [Letharia lupina]KAF6222574.1 hypothetical protein HO133_000620 [Letharia lupina]
MAPPASQTKIIGKPSGELVPSTSYQAFNTPDSQLMILDLSQDTINGLMTAFGGMMRQEMQRFEQRLERIEQFLGPALYQNPTSSPNPTPPPNATPLPSIEIPQQKLSHTNDSSYHTNPGHLRAEEVGYFDPEYQQEQEQEHRPLQQANVEKTAEKFTENTTEKSSDNKATIIKNTAQLSKIPRHILSTIPRQIATQQAENDTTIWPAISACLGNITLVWHITAMSKQEKDLLRRSQPNYYDQQAKATHISLTSHRMAMRSMRKMRRRIRSIMATSNGAF